jgi:hypothetical protein
MSTRMWIVVAVMVAVLGGTLLVVVQTRRDAAPLLMIHVRSEPPVHLFTNAAPEVVRKHLSNAYQLVPLDLKSVTNITEVDVDQLKNAVVGKSSFSAACTAIEFITYEEAIVRANTLLGARHDYLFRKSGSQWELIHKRSTRE